MNAVEQGSVEIAINENGIATIEFFHPLSNSLPGKILNKLATADINNRPLPPSLILFIIIIAKKYEIFAKR